MKQAGKRLCAVLLAMALCLGLFPVMASADDVTPTLITSLSEITDLSGSYKLTADTTVTKPLLGEFTGTFDGDGHTVTINIVKDGTIVGMFETIQKSGVVKNFVVDSATVIDTSGSQIGAIAGDCFGTISDIRVKEINLSGMEKTGGLVGVLERGGTVTRCCIDSGTLKKGSTGDTPLRRYRRV